MHLNAPRIAPVSQDQWTAEQAELAAPMVTRGTMLNIFKTLLNHPDAMRGFMGWGSYVLSKKNSLSSREREIVVLRTGFLCGSGYEWTQHVPIGQRAGLSDAEIAAIKLGAEATIWNTADAALIRASDELHRRQFVSDATWLALKAHFSDKQCMDVVFTAGQYTQVSMLLNTFGVQLDEGQELDPQLRAYKCVS
jgi:4-carboxymuconolactone decarboxylase